MEEQWAVSEASWVLEKPSFAFQGLWEKLFIESIDICRYINIPQFLRHKTYFFFFTATSAWYLAHDIIRNTDLEMLTCWWYLAGCRTRREQSRRLCGDICVLQQCPTLAWFAMRAFSLRCLNLDVLYHLLLSSLWRLEAFQMKRELIYRSAALL